MNAPEETDFAPADWQTAPCPLPKPLLSLEEQADEYQREAIATAQSEAAFEANIKEFNK